MTTVYKDIRGNWAADTRIPCKGLPADHILEITTRRSYNGSYFTSATVFKIIDENTREHAVYQDFSQNIDRAKFRATQNTVKRFHDDNVNLAFRNEIEKQAIAFYQSKNR